jgi:hypothetical protein
MSLKALCVKNMVNQIKNLPPLLLEEIIGESLKSIKEEAKKEAIKEIRDSASIVVDDITNLLITSHKTGGDWKRPEYTKDIDDELYYTFVDISEQFFEEYGEKLLFDENRPRHRRHATVYYGGDSSDEDSDY